MCHIYTVGAGLRFCLINYPAAALRAPSGQRESISQVTALKLSRCMEQQTFPRRRDVSSVCCVRSLLEALCVVLSELDSSRKLSDDVCAAHQLGEHVAVPHDIRIEQIPLRRGGSTAASLAAAAFSG